MPIQTANLLAPLSQLHPFRMDPTGESPYQTEQLKLMREQFEETKRRNREDERLRQLAEEQAKVREQMITERQAAKAKAEADAAILGKKQEALQKFSETNGKGDIEGARTMVPYMSSLGMVVDLEGEANGLPRYRIYMSQAEKDQADRERAALGYPGDDSEPIQGPAGIGSTAEAFQRAQQAMPGLAEADAGKVTSDATEGAVDLNQPTLEQGATNFQAARGPDEADVTGSVPRNVIDMSAIGAGTVARLSPYLNSIVSSYPLQYQDSARSTATGVAGLNLPLMESIKQFQDARRSPDSLMQADIAAQAQAGNQEATREAARLQQAQERANAGTRAVNEAADKFKIGDVWERRRTTGLTLDVLQNKDSTDDYLAGANISRMMGEKGATTEEDIGRALGNAAPSFFDRLNNRLFHEAIGGLSPTQRGALIRVLKNSMEADKARVNDFLDNTDEAIASEKNDPDYKRGVESQRNLLTPRDWRDERAAAKKKRDEANRKPAEPQPFNMEEDSKAEYGTRPSPETGGDFETELQRQAPALGLNPAGVKYSVMAESGGDPTAKNKSGATGAMQIMPDNLEAMGISPEEYAKLSTAEQVPYMLRYFKDRDLTADATPDQYYVAVAAGAFGPNGERWWKQPDNTVVYPKGSKGWEQNKPWRPTDGGDITVGSIKAYGRRANGLSPEAPAAQTASLGTNDTDRIRAILRKNAR